MVDELHNVGEGRPVAAYGENNDVVKQQLQERKVNVPMTGGPAKDERRGTSVQHSGGNPFYEETDFEHFDGLGGSGMTQADSATKRVKGELARLYNEVKRTNPEAVETLEFPPLPSVPKKGKKSLKLEAYLNALDQYRQTCEELLEGVKEQTVVDEVRASAQDVKDTVVAMGSANLAATLGVGEAMLDGLQTVYNKIDTDTKVIISAVNSNGQRVLRAIDKNTKEIKELVMAEGQMTRDQEYWNSVVADIRNSDRIDGVHRHIDEKGNWLANKIDKAEDNINEHTTKQAKKTRSHVSDEHDETRNFTKDEIEEHTVFWHGLPDPLGVLDKIFR